MKFGLNRWVLSAAAPLLAACATTGSSDKSPPPFHSLAVWAGFATNAEEPADFVKASRPQGKLDYLPVGVTPEGPKVKAKKLTPEELKALEDQLEATRQKNATAAGVAP
jgi:hypothetical protein